MTNASVNAADHRPTPDWKAQIEAALDAFETVADLGCEPGFLSYAEVAFLPAPHRPPSRLPVGRMAVYGFWGDGAWLKIGKAGPNSNARYTSQHYNKDSARSTLAASLCKCLSVASLAGFDPALPGTWIKTSTHRVNILIPDTKPRELLSLLEAFLHLRLRPRYEQ